MNKSIQLPNLMTEPCEEIRKSGINKRVNYIPIKTESIQGDISMKYLINGGGGGGGYIGKYVCSKNIIDPYGKFMSV